MTYTIYSPTDIADAITVAKIVDDYRDFVSEMGIKHSADSVSHCLAQWPAADFGDGDTGNAIAAILNTYGAKGLTVDTFGDDNYRPAFVFGYMDKGAQRLRYRMRNNKTAPLVGIPAENA